MMHWKRTSRKGQGLCLLALISLSAPAAAQVLSEIGHFGESISTVAVDGNRGVFNEGTRVRVMDITDPSAPTFHGSVDLGVVPAQLFLVGNTAYSVSPTAGLHIIDIANMNAPAILSFKAGQCWYGDVWVRRVQDYAYVGQCGFGVAVYDVRDKSNPVLVRELTEIQDCSFGITGDGGYLYATDNGGPSALHIWSLANPADPVYMAGLDLAGSGNLSVDVKVFGDTLYLGQPDGTRVVDISDRTSPSVVGALTTTFTDTLAINRGVLHVANRNSLRLWALASPTAPDFLSENSTYPVNLVGQIAAQGDYTFSAHNDSLFITDVTQDPPLIVATHAVTPGFNLVKSLARIGTTLIVGLDRGLASFDISDPTSPVLLQTTRLGFSRDLKVVGDLIYRLGFSVLEVWDAQNPNALQILSSYPVLADGIGIIDVEGSRLASVSAGEVKLFAVGADGLLTEQSVLTPAGDARAVALRDTAMYVLPIDGNLLVYDVSNLSNPVLQSPISIGVPNANGFGGDLEAEGDRLHVFSARRGYVLLDITNRLAPTILGSFDETLLDAKGLAVAGSAVYLGATGWCGKWGVRALDISSPGQITELGAVDATYFTEDVLAYNGVVYVAEENGGLRIRSGVPSGAAGRWNRFQ